MEQDEYTRYPHLRQVMDPRIAALSDEQIEDLFESAFGEGVTPAEYEEFFGGIGRALSGAATAVGRAAQKAAPIATTAFGGALKGAASGAALGPWGALGGAVLGGTGAALQRHGPAGARGVGGLLSGVVGTAGSLAGPGGLAGGLGGLAATLGARSPAAAQLMNVLRNPAIIQALGALASGRNPAIPVGAAGTRVPANAFAGLLSALGREAEAESEAFATGPVGAPAYLVGESGEFVVDPRDPDQRAGRLLQLLNEEEWADADDEAAEDEIEWEEVDWETTEEDPFQVAV